MASSVAPVREFGIYAALVTLISLGLILCCLPALLAIVPLNSAIIREPDGGAWALSGHGAADRGDHDDPRSNRASRASEPWAQISIRAACVTV